MKNAVMYNDSFSDGQIHLSSRKKEERKKSDGVNSVNYTEMYCRTRLWQKEDLIPVCGGFIVHVEIGNDYMIQHIS